MSIAAEIIKGIFNVGSSMITGKTQSDILDIGQEEDREKWRTELEYAKKQNKKSEAITRKQLAENKRQFDLSYDLSREGLAMQRESIARDSFRDQVSRLTGVLEKNEQLKNLYTNRLAGLGR